MTLATEWAARLSTDRQLQLTNPDARTATGNDAARLAAACADAAREFQTITGIVFDPTDADHIRVGIRGVTAYLLTYGPMEQSDYAKAQMDIWVKSASALANLDPASTSRLTPSDPDESAGPVRPDFDREHFEGLTPRAPEGGGGLGPPGFFS